MRRLVYTAVFGGYDRVYPPVRPESDVDYRIFTDDPDMKVRGWKVHHVDAAGFATPKAANLYHRALVHRILKGYDASLYVDGNVRLLAQTRPLFEELKTSGAAVAMYRHPLRTTVAAEVDAIIAAGKVAEPDDARREYASYVADGFCDTVPLTETTVILKNHRADGLDEAMALWWTLFDAHLSRDQISFPYVAWKTGLKVHLMPGTFRKPNPYFAVYPHYRAVEVNPRYVHVAARSHDSLTHKLLLNTWHASWRLRRKMRRLREGGTQ